MSNSTITINTAPAMKALRKLGETMSKLDKTKQKGKATVSRFNALVSRHKAPPLPPGDLIKVFKPYTKGKFYKFPTGKIYRATNPGTLRKATPAELQEIQRQQKG